MFAGNLPSTYVPLYFSFKQELDNVPKEKKKRRVGWGAG